MLLLLLNVCRSYLRQLLVGLFVFVVGVLSCSGQSAPVYGQYMFNPVVINPAYAGLHDMASFYGIYRQQWTGIEGVNPETFTISGQSTLPQNNLGVGASFVYDAYGYLKTYEFYELSKNGIKTENLVLG